MVTAAAGGGGGGGATMSVKIDHTALKGAIDKLSTLAGAVEAQRVAVTSGTPISLPSLSDGSLTRTTNWLKDQEPLLQGLHDIAVLLATKGSTVASFTVGTKVDDVRQMLGETLADQASMGNPNFPEDQEKYLEIFSQWQFDPATMAAFHNALGPEETLRVLSMWADAPADRPMTEPPDDVQAALVAAMKRSLVTANLPGGFTRAESEAYAHGLVEAATIPVEDYYGRGPYNPSGALNYLLYDSTFNDTFVRTIANDLDHYERVTNKGASGLWASRPDQGVDFGDYMEHGTYDPYAGNADPMTGLMSAMSHNPGVALDFFSDDDGDPPRGEYYIKDRNWDRDAYNGLMQALDAATTDESLINGSESDQHRAALLASATVEHLSERGNVEELPEIFARWPEHGAAEDLSHILGTYMNGVVPGLDNENSGIDAFGNRPAFDAESLRSVSLAAMSTDQGIAELTNGMNNYRVLYIGEAADRLAETDNGTNRQLLENAVQNDARLQGFFLNTLGDSEIREAAAQDAATRAMIGHLTDIVDLVPVPGVSKLDGVAGDIANMTINTAKGEAYDSFADSMAHAESDTRTDMNNLAQETNVREQFTMAQFLADRGLLNNVDGLSGATAPGGHLVSYDDYTNLGSAEQDQVELELFGENGVGGVYSHQHYSEAFMSEFEKYFD